MAIREVVGLDDIKRTDSAAYLYLKWDCDNNKFKWKIITKGVFPYTRLGNGRDFKVANFDQDKNLDFAVAKRKRAIANDTASNIAGADIYVWHNFYDRNENSTHTGVVLQGISGDSKIEVIDYDGDGLSDVAVITTSGMSAFKYGTTFYPIPNSNVSDLKITNDSLFHFGDFNGDGITDMLKGTGSADAPFASYEIRLGTGNGFSSTAYTNVSNVANAQDVYLIDINNDGKTDIIQKVTTSLSSQYKFISSISIGFSNGKHRVKTLPETYKNVDKDSPLAFGDFNGDGTIDYIYWRPVLNFPRPRIYFMYFKDNFSLKVYTITESMGVKHVFDYNPVEYNSRFRLNKNHIKYVIDVVKRHRIQLPSNALIADKNYVFENSYYDHDRQSFLGFENLTVTDNVSETKNLISYTLIKSAHQLRKGSSYTSKLRQNGDTLIWQQKLNTLSVHIGNKRYVIYHETNTITDFNKSCFETTKTLLNSDGKIRRTSTSFCNLVNITRRYNIDNEYYYIKPLINGRYAYRISSSVLRKMEGYGNYAYFLQDSTSYTYNSKGNPICIVNNADGKILQTDFTYNSLGLPTQQKISGTVAGSRTENYGYDSKGRFMTSKSSHYNYIESWTHDKATGNPLTYTDMNNNTSYYTYDGFGRLKTTTLPTGHTENLSYIWANPPLWIDVSDAKYAVDRYQNGNLVESNCYDVLDRNVLSMQNGVYTQTKYNAKGLVSGISLPFANNNEKVWMNYQYNLYDQLVLQQGPYTNLTMTYAVDSYYEPYIETVTDNIRNTSTEKSYTTYGLLAKVVDNAGQLNYEYKTEKKGNTVVRQTKIKLNNAHTTTIEEDIHGNRLSLSDPDAGTITSEYNEFNELIKQTDANGVVSTYGYDSLGRVLQCTMIKPNVDTIVTTYTYDANNVKGTLSSETIVPDNTAIMYTYNNLAQLTGKTYIAEGDSLAYSYTYNSKGQLQNITYPYGFAIQQEYDGYGRLKDINWVNEATPIYNVKSFASCGNPNNTVSGETMGTFCHYNVTGRLINKFTGSGYVNVSGNFIMQDTNVQYIGYSYGYLNGYDNTGLMYSRTKDHPSPFDDGYTKVNIFSFFYRLYQKFYYLCCEL